jgi:ABC-2 type transport system permease protein
MIRRIAHLARKELIQIQRDRLLMLVLLIGPVLQFYLLGQVSSSDIRLLPMAVVDQDKTSLSRQLATALDNTPELRLTYSLEDRGEMDDLLAEGKVRLGLVIQPDFAATIGRGETASILIVADSSNYIEGSTALRVAQGAVAAFTQRTLLAGRPGLTAGIQIATNVQFNPGMNVRIYTIPAQLGFVVFQISMLVAALSFARERELGTLEQLHITPLRPTELILGKALTAMLAGLANFAILMLVAVHLFGVPMRGSLLDLVLLTLVFLTANVAAGMVVSLLCRTQQQALLIFFLIAVLQVNLSGYLVSVKDMPPAFQFLAEFTPLRHYLTIIRENMLKGTGLDMLAPHAAALGAQTLGAAAGAWGLLRRRGA